MIHCNSCKGEIGRKTRKNDYSGALKFWTSKIQNLRNPDPTKNEYTFFYQVRTESVSYTHLDVYKRQESTFANHLIEANHTYKNIDNNMNILHVHTKGRKLDTLGQLEI